jgi:hypothetical protein
MKGKATCDGAATMPKNVRQTVDRNTRQCACWQSRIHLNGESFTTGENFHKNITTIVEATTIVAKYRIRMAAKIVSGNLAS